MFFVLLFVLFGMGVLSVGAVLVVLVLFGCVHSGVGVTSAIVFFVASHFFSFVVFAAVLSSGIFVLLQSCCLLCFHFALLVSFSMVVLVGLGFVPFFFAGLGALVDPRVLLLLQVITFFDPGYGGYCAGVVFLQLCVFPFGCFVCVAEFARSLPGQPSFFLFFFSVIGLDSARFVLFWVVIFDGAIAGVGVLCYV